MEPFLTPAVVVRLVGYGEADRVVTLLTRTHGKLSAMARGARRSQRRFGSGMGIFAVGTATLRDRPRAQLLELAAWETEGSVAGLVTDVAKLAHAGYVCEAARELSAAGQKDAAVFELLVETLAV